MNMLVEIFLTSFNLLSHWQIHRLKTLHNSIHHNLSFNTKLYTCDYKKVRHPPLKISFLNLQSKFNLWEMAKVKSASYLIRLGHLDSSPWHPATSRATSQPISDNQLTLHLFSVWSFLFCFFLNSVSPN